MDFGTVCVQSKTAKSFGITNELNRSILVAVTFASEDLAQSGPSSQVVPPGASAGFDVVYSSNHIKQFREVVQVRAPPPRASPPGRLPPERSHLAPGVPRALPGCRPTRPVAPSLN